MSSELVPSIACYNRSVLGPEFFFFLLATHSSCWSRDRLYISTMIADTTLLGITVLLNAYLIFGSSSPSERSPLRLMSRLYKCSRISLSDLNLPLYIISSSRLYCGTSLSYSLPLVLDPFCVVPFLDPFCDLSRSTARCFFRFASTYHGILCFGSFLGLF